MDIRTAQQDLYMLESCGSLRLTAKTYNSVMAEVAAFNTVKQKYVDEPSSLLEPQEATTLCMIKDQIATVESTYETMFLQTCNELQRFAKKSSSVQRQQAVITDCTNLERLMSLSGIERPALYARKDDVLQYALTTMTQYAPKHKKQLPKVSRLQLESQSKSISSMYKVATISVLTVGLCVGLGLYALKPSPAKPLVSKQSNEYKVAKPAQATKASPMVEQVQELEAKVLQLESIQKRNPIVDSTRIRLIEMTTTVLSKKELRKQKRALRKEYKKQKKALKRRRN